MEQLNAAAGWAYETAHACDSALDLPVVRLMILVVPLVLALVMLGPILRTVLLEGSRLRNYIASAIVVGLIGVLIMVCSQAPDAAFDLEDGQTTAGWRFLVQTLRTAIRFVGLVETQVFGYSTIGSVFPRTLLKG